MYHEKTYAVYAVGDEEVRINCYEVLVCNSTGETLRVTSVVNHQEADSYMKEAFKVAAILSFLAGEADHREKAAQWIGEQVVPLLNQQVEEELSKIPPEKRARIEAAVANGNNN